FVAMTSFLLADRKCKRGLPSSGKLALLLAQVAEDLAVRPSQLWRHAPDIDRPEEAERTHADRRDACARNVTPPLAPVAEQRESPDVDIHALGDVDVDVPEARQDGHRRGRDVDLRLAQVEVDVRERADDKRPPPETEAAAPHDVAEERAGETSRLPARLDRRGRNCR